MTLPGKLKSDIHHPFIAKLKEYRDEGLLEREFKRRKRLMALREDGKAVHEAIGAVGHGGGRPNMTAEETKELVDGITEGKTVPSPLQIYNLAVQLGFIKGQVTDFLNLGGDYLRHCMAISLERQYVPKTTELIKDEDFVAVVKEILGSVKLSYRESNGKKDIFRPSDVGYGTVKKTAKIHDIFTEGRGLAGTEVGAKLRSLMHKSYRLSVDPTRNLFTPKDWSTLSFVLKFTSAEEMRLAVAYDRFCEPILALKDPQVQDQQITRILSEFLDKTEIYQGPARAFDALIDILHVRNARLHSLEESAALLTKGTTYYDKITAFDRILEEYDLNKFDGIKLLRKQFFNEKMKDHKSVGHTRRIIRLRSEGADNISPDL